MKARAIPRAEASHHADAAVRHEARAAADAIWERMEGPDFGESAKGIEGMRLADEVLREHGAVGILIGGLLREVWGEDTTYQSMKAHKDVDVLILDTDKYLPKRKWEHRIDWWAMDENGVIKSPGSWGTFPMDMIKPITFSYTVESSHKEAGLAPGLYIPGYEFTEAMMLIEAMRYSQETGLSEADTSQLLKDVKSKLSITGSIVSEENQDHETWPDSHPLYEQWLELPDTAREDDKAFERMVEATDRDAIWTRQQCPDQVQYLDSSIFRIESLLGEASNEKILDVVDPHWRMFEQP